MAVILEIFYENVNTTKGRTLDMSNFTANYKTYLDTKKAFENGLKEEAR